MSRDIKVRIRFEMKTLVTGVAGFIESYIVDKLMKWIGK